MDTFGQEWFVTTQADHKVEEGLSRDPWGDVMPDIRCYRGWRHTKFAASSRLPEDLQHAANVNTAAMNSRHIMAPGGSLSRKDSQ
jgi:hypothetical protein